MQSDVKQMIQGRLKRIDIKLSAEIMQIWED